MLEAFDRRGYEICIIHPEAAEIDGHRCARSIGALDVGVDAALLLLPRDAIRHSLEDCLRAGVKRIWLYGTHGDKGIDASHIAIARSDGAAVIAGQCPMMHFPDPGLVHRFHGWVQKMSGNAPR